MLPSTAGQDPQAGYGYDGEPGDRGYRRKRLAAMAGSMYRAGASAVTGIKESYAQTRVASLDPSEGERPSIPESFPDASIATSPGDHEQLVLFPTYAKLHVKRDPKRMPSQAAENPERPEFPGEEGMNAEWEDEYVPGAVVDVDVRGWIYAPLKGPLTRKNRILMGLARQLSGIPKPDAMPTTGAGDERPGPTSSSEDLGEQEKIAAEAANIERRGREERRAANFGQYSETPGRSESRPSTAASRLPGNSSRSSSNPPSPPLSTTQPSTSSTELTEAELATANANLNARIAPFLTTPFPHQPITVFFYNDTRSQSRTVVTDTLGHFSLRAALEFKPTHVRVLAHESLSAVQEVQVTESAGVSLISDIDDTIKRSNISGGTREIFRNTFVRELAGLTVDGVKDWYNRMYSMGVGMHYCSNSPWQLYPVLTNYFKLSGLPPGSMHLKAYNGMLQGIFEPVAERKKPVLERILSDFPERKFILVGDSGEADLEVYTELAVANPGRVLAIFIRDVTTPEQPGFFDASFEAALPQASNGRGPGTEKSGAGSNASDRPGNRPALPPRGITPSPKPEEVPTGDLIDLSDDVAAFENGTPTPTRASARNEPAARAPPPRPAKPAALKSSPTGFKDVPSASGGVNGSGAKGEWAPPPPPRPAKPAGIVPQRASAHPLSRTVNASGQTASGRSSPAGSNGVARTGPSPNRTTGLQPPPPPPPRRNGTPSSAPRANPQTGEAPSLPARPGAYLEPLPPPVRQLPPRQRTATSSSTNTQSSQESGYAAVSKKLELWRRRLERAQEVLEGERVALYTWRRGEDVMREAVGIVRAELEGRR